MTETEFLVFSTRWSFLQFCSLQQMATFTQCLTTKTKTSFLTFFSPASQLYLENTSWIQLNLPSPPLPYLSSTHHLWVGLLCSLLISPMALIFVPWLSFLSSYKQTITQQPNGLKCTKQSRPLSNRQPPMISHHTQKSSKSPRQS